MSTYAYNMYSHDIKYNVEFFIIIRHRNFPQHFVREMFEKLARLLTRWQANLKNWHVKLKHCHVYWHVGT